MAKIDKEQLLKNKFWIMLGAATLLVLICWLVLLIGGSSAGDAQHKKFDDTLKAVQTNAKGTPKNDNFKKPWDEYGEKFTVQKEGVWKQAWETQQTMYSWPWQEKARFDQVKYYDDDVGPDSNAARKIYAKELYRKQFDDLAKIVAPVEFNGGDAGFQQIMAPATNGGGGGSSPVGSEGGMVGKKGGMSAMMPGGGTPGGPSMPGGGGAGGQSIASIWRDPDKTPPTMEEVWLAQEDFWVKREMLKILRDALDKYAQFQPVEIPKDEPLPEKIVSRHRFRNPSWEITLLIEEVKDKGRTATTVSPRSTIKNVSATRRTQLVANARTGKGLKFLIKQGDRDFPLTVEGEPVPYGASVEFKKAVPVESLNFKNPIALEQVLEWATSPIRRIDDLRTAKNSHRLAFMALKHNEALYKEKKAEETTDTSSQSPGGPGGGYPGAPAMPGMPGMPGGPGGPGLGTAAATSSTPNGLERDRYLLTNEQCRHLPIGMVLVVDQAAINDVLIAVANSPLRIQITQVSALHVHDSGPLGADGDSGPSGADPAGPGGTVGPGGPGAPGGPGRPSYPSGMMPPGGTPGAVGVDAAEGDNNLFELTVYGVATLYERFPARKPKEPSTDTK